jgi:hypothetical protein
MASWATRPAASPTELRLKPRGTRRRARYCRRPVTAAPGSDDDGPHTDGSVELNDAVAPVLRWLHLVSGLVASAGNSSMQASDEVGASGGSRMTCSGDAGGARGCGCWHGEGQGLDDGSSGDHAMTPGSGWCGARWALGRRDAGSSGSLMAVSLLGGGVMGERHRRGGAHRRTGLDDLVDVRWHELSSMGLRRGCTTSGEGGDGVACRLVGRF